MTNYEQYLERYCTKHECSVEVAKTHALCKEVEKYYQNPASYNLAQRNTIKVGCGGAISGGDCK